MSANEIVTRNVVHELERRGMNRADLARVVGHARSWATRRLSGERRWSVDDLDVLAGALGVPLERLVRRTTTGYRALVSGLPIGSPARLAGLAA